MSTSKAREYIKKAEKAGDTDDAIKNIIKAVEELVGAVRALENR